MENSSMDYTNTAHRTFTLRQVLLCSGLGLALGVAAGSFLIMYTQRVPFSESFESVRGVSVTSERDTTSSDVLGTTEFDDVLTEEEIKNATYLLPENRAKGSGFESENVRAYTFSDGEYLTESDSTFGDRGFSIQHEIVYGDINRDGLRDALVRVLKTTGGTMHFVDLNVLLNVNGKPVHAARMDVSGGLKQIIIDETDGVITLEIGAGCGGAGSCSQDEIEFTQQKYLFRNNSFELMATD